jgi:flagellar basal-body rod protein FlgC
LDGTCPSSRCATIPGHPAADENGYVRTPNVSSIIEMNNMREAARSYEANMNMYEAARTMRRQMLDLLK